jgi:hypothetical protein
MSLQPPSPQTNVQRGDAGNVVDAMLLDPRVKWIAVVFETTANGIDQFTVTPYIADPTSGG